MKNKISFPLLGIYILSILYGVALISLGGFSLTRWILDSDLNILIKLSVVLPLILVVVLIIIKIILKKNKDYLDEK